jgi:alpha-tubulin suppressor-like RCC1 family protein
MTNQTILIGRFERKILPLALLAAGAGLWACSGEFRTVCPEGTVQTAGGGDIDNACKAPDAPAGLAGAGGSPAAAAGAGQGAGGTPETPLICDGADERACAGACVNVQIDNQHCGACGRACSGTCRAGSCTPVVQIALGANHSCAILADTTVKCWGANDAGQLGNGTTTTAATPTPTPVTDLRDVAQLALGKQHSCARLGEDGGVKCWGDNTFGQLSTPIQGTSIRPLADYIYGQDGIFRGGEHSVATIRNLASGNGHLCVEDLEASLFCWGQNLRGQVGNGTLNPVRLADLKIEPPGGAFESAGLLSLGGAHTIVINAGQFWAWGSNETGQTDPTEVFLSSAEPLLYGKPGNLDITSSGLTIVQISAGGAHTCVLLSNETTHCWGDDEYGQNGRDESQGQAVAIDQPALAETALLSSGDQHTCALDKRGVVHCWGRGFEGQLGDSSLSSEQTPVALAPFPARVLQIATGGFHTCARLEDNSVYCWGKNDSGQLGDGTTTNRAVPTRVTF